MPVMSPARRNALAGELSHAPIWGMMRRAVAGNLGLDEKESEAGVVTPSFPQIKQQRIQIPKDQTMCATNELRCCGTVFGTSSETASILGVLYTHRGVADARFTDVNGRQHNEVVPMD